MAFPPLAIGWKERLKCVEWDIEHCSDANNIGSADFSYAELSARQTHLVKKLRRLCNETYLLSVSLVAWRG